MCGKTSRSLPISPSQRCTFLHVRPVDEAPTDGKPSLVPSFFTTCMCEKSWEVEPGNEARFVNQRVGLNTLKSFVPQICGVAGFPKRYTNYSLRATGITRMFSAAVPEKIIAEESGHRSLKASRFYKHT